MNQEAIEELGRQLSEIQQHTLITGDGIYSATNGKTYKFRGAPKHIRNKMEFDKLPEDEILEVLEMNREYKRLRGSLTMIQRQLGNDGITFLQNPDLAKAMERSEELLDLFGKMYSGMEVHKIVTTEWGLLNVKYEQILKFQRANTDTIETLKDTYQKEVTNVRLVHKRSRLDELTEMYGSRKQKYEETKTKSDYELMLKTLEQIRKEVEGQRISINGQIQVEHEIQVQEHVNTEILKYLNINDIIIGRLCARLKVNPKYILYRLHTSYYSKFTGFLPNEISDENEVVYPSQVVYDFDRIAKLNDDLNIQDVEYKEEPAVEDEVKSKSMKDLLLEKLAKKKEEIANKRKNIGNIDVKESE